MTTLQQASAQDVFKEAFENRYTWTIEPSLPTFPRKMKVMYPSQAL